MESIVYTPAEVAQVLRLKTATVYTLIREGAIPSIRIGNNYKIPKHLLEQWLTDLAEEQTEERRTKISEQKERDSHH